MKGRSIHGFSLAALLFALLPATPACANDILWSQYDATKDLPLLVALMCIPTLFVMGIEQSLLEKLLPISTKQAALASLMANVVSLAIGALWFSVNETGWKTSILRGHWNLVVLLTLRSYLVTVAEETVVVGLLLGKTTDIVSTTRAVAAANLVTYLLLLVLTVLLVNI